MNYEKALLNCLLDRYERSQGFVENRSQRRRILLRLYDAGQTDFKAYDIENNQARVQINEAVFSLSSQGILSFDWMKGQEDHLIARIFLLENALSQAYQTAGRQPLAPKVDALLAQFQHQLTAAQHNWAKNYWQEQLDFLQRHRRLPRTFPEQENEQKEWFAVLTAADAVRDEPILERVFSLRCLGDSKRFEQHYRNRLCSVLRHYLLPNTSEITEEELFQQINLEKYPEIFSLCGDVELQQDNGVRLPLGAFTYGALLDSREVAHAHFRLPNSIQRILWIENKANYYDYLAKDHRLDELVVFHGGFFSPARGRFFQKLCQAAGPKVQLLHWGDIDLGGFQMHARLRKEIDPRFTCFRMDVAELERHASLGRTFPSTYRAQLQNLLSIPELDAAHPCIRYMLKHNIRLEQEALL